MVNFKFLENNYKGKKVFVTGHTGFKGSWMIKTLTLLGAEVKGYALLPNTNNDLFYLIQGEKICESIISDLRDKTRLESEIVSFQPDYIFHLAAQPLVRESYDIPNETFEINIMGTANVLDAVRKLNKKCNIILITTDKVYHNNEWIYPYREDDQLGGYDPYSSSKACAELLIDSYRNSFFNRNEYDKHLKGIAVARAGNVIGGGDWSKDRLIPDIIRALMVNEIISIRNPRSIRPWQHVLEPIIGYLTLGLHLEHDPSNFSQAFNFGPHTQDALSVEQMLKLSINAWGSGRFNILTNENQPHEAGVLKLDISKARELLKWTPKMNAVETVHFTIDWYKNFKMDPNNICEFTTQQIFDFIDA